MAATKKAQQQLLLDDEDSEGEEKEVRGADVTGEEVPEAEAENPPDYKDRVVSTKNSDNRPSIGKVGEYIAEKKAYEITFTYSDELEPNTHVDFCPQHWVENNLVDTETAAAWTQAVDKALEGSNTSRKRKESSRESSLPEKRTRASTTLYKPHENTPQAKRRG